jgi:hypothetical protein
VDLILLQVGESEINPTTADQEAIFIQQPRPNSMIQGGVLLVSGYARPETSLPLTIQLVTESGAVVGSRMVSVNQAAIGEYGTFAVEVPYRVQELTQVRLTVFSEGEQINQVNHLSSLLILVAP